MTRKASHAPFPETAFTDEAKRVVGRIQEKLAFIPHHSADARQGFEAVMKSASEDIDQFQYTRVSDGSHHESFPLQRPFFEALRAYVMNDEARYVRTSKTLFSEDGDDSLVVSTSNDSKKIAAVVAAYRQIRTAEHTPTETMQSATSPDQFAVSAFKAQGRVITPSQKSARY